MTTVSLFVEENNSKTSLKEISYHLTILLEKIACVKMKLLHISTS